MKTEGDLIGSIMEAVAKNERRKPKNEVNSVNKLWGTGINCGKTRD
jgi:hypothetical protein